MTPLHDLSNEGANALHLVNRESISASKVAGCARGQDVAFNVWQGVVDPVQPSRLSDGPAVSARLGNYLGNLGTAEIAGVHALICLPEKDGAAPVGSTVAEIARLCPSALLLRHIRPTLLTAVAPLPPLPVAGRALIGAAKRAARVLHELFERQFGLAAIAGSHVGTVAQAHCGGKLE